MEKDRLFSKTAPLPPAGGKPNAANKKDKDKKSVLQMPLDHNNMLNSVKPKEQTTVKRILKTTRVPAIRQYPGELQVATKRMIETFNFDDFNLDGTEKEHENPFAKELTAEDLMRDPEYLKIDQSKLPLEIFDNIELQALDKTPEEWVASGSMAQTPYYHAGEWIWRPVVVDGYDEATKQYVVHFHPMGITKKVMRLKLMFDMEDQEKFMERRNRAENAREEAKRIMRLDYFIS
eukprot:gene28549-32244_t